MAQKAKSPRSKKNHRPKWTKKLEDFCQAVFTLESPAQAAIVAGYAPLYGYQLMMKPDIHQRLEEIKNEYAKFKFEHRMEKQLVKEEFLDLHLIQLVARAKSEHVRLESVQTGYRKLKLIDDSGVKITNTNALGIGGGTMAEVYKSKWLRDKESALATQFESEVESSARVLPETAS